MTSPPQADPGRTAQIRAKLDAVRAAACNGELDVFNRSHHASWDDIEYLLDLVAPPAVDEGAPDPADRVAELEALLNAKDDRQIEILPNGQIRELGAPDPAGMEKTKE